MLFIDILFNSLLDLTTLIDHKLSVHVLQFVVSKVSGDVCKLDRSRSVELNVWSIFEFMGLERISSNENNLFIYRVLHVTNPLYSIFSHVEAELFVSWINLASVCNVLVLNELGLCIFHAPHS